MHVKSMVVPTSLTSNLPKITQVKADTTNVCLYPNIKRKPPLSRMTPIVHRSSAHTGHNRVDADQCALPAAIAASVVAPPSSGRFIKLFGLGCLLKNPLSCLPSAALCGSKHAPERRVGLAGEAGSNRGRHKNPNPR